MEAIKVSQLDVAYDDKYIIKNMNLEIPKGKITMIIGSNGCGKSTLLKSIARIIMPKKGDILLNGVALKEQAPKEIAKKMAVLPQSPSVPSGLLVKELVSYGRFPYQSAMGGLKQKDIELIKPKKGDILLNGVALKEQAPKEIAKKMAVLPQSPSVPSGLLVKELVSYGRFPYQSAMGGLKQKDIELINWAMEVTGISDFANRPVDRLSGGQRQRAWIAMALAQDTEILVLDEPTTYLDMAHQLEILLLLKKLNQEANRTIVMVLHELNNATKFADYLVGVKEGEVVFAGHPLEVVTTDHLRTLYGIEATLQLDESKQYPICVDFNIAR